MSWKLFSQIVLLIVIAAIVMTTAKISIYKCGFKRLKQQHRYMQEYKK